MNSEHNIKKKKELDTSKNIVFNSQFRPIYVGWQIWKRSTKKKLNIDTTETNTHKDILYMRFILEME